MGARVIGIGDNVCDKYYPAMMMYPGGQALNFSVYAKMLGADSAYMGVFGRDEVSAHVMRTLDELKVERIRCRQYDGENGYAKVRLVNGDREFITSNRGGVANLHPLELDEEDLAYIRTFDLIHTSQNGHFDGQLARAKSTGVPLSYDFSGRWRDPYYTDTVAPQTDYVFASCGSVPEDEIKAYCRMLISRGCRMVIATRGSEGSLVYDGERFYRNVPERVDAVDTLGAGDSFATAFLLSVLQGDGIGEAMEKGARFAAKTCMVNGAFGHGTAFRE